MNTLPRQNPPADVVRRQPRIRVLSAITVDDLNYQLDAYRGWVLHTFTARLHTDGHTEYNAAIYRGRDER